jgi:CDP-paratose 2-epimerase
MPTILITGSAGFIGTNTVVHFAERGWRVVALDNLSRPGVDENLRWAQQRQQFQFLAIDIRDREAMDRVVTTSRPDVVLHLAGQVAVTLSVADPRADFESNAIGSLNLLEAVRRFRPQAFVIYASTNKVYGDLIDVGVVERNGRYELQDLPQGVSEGQPLRFHSPYGCSKGTADQYVLDYHKSFGLRTVSMRQSCIYGPRQFGAVDQGWLAWFLIAAETGRPITIYGDGKQTRDILHVDDLVAAYDAAIENSAAAAGQAFNVGGGPSNALSLRELVTILEAARGSPLPISWADWRIGDQRVFVSDIRKAARVLGWSPRIPMTDGIEQLSSWVRENRSLFPNVGDSHSSPHSSPGGAPQG